MTDHARELAEEYKRLVVAVLQRREAWQVIDSVHQMTDPAAIADAAGYAPYLSSDRKRELLEDPDVESRLEKLIGWTRDYLAESELTDKIGEDVREGMEKQQREYLLRQQLAAIRKELGEGEPEGAEDYRARVEAADLPEAVRAAALKEVDKLERSSEQNPEAAWIRTWLDTVLELPWGVTTEDSNDVVAARAVLDADHHGLEEVKERIVEYLAVRARRAERGLQVVGGRGSGAVILLAGPPGVGKTSLGESVARTMGREFVRVALGGVRDEAEIRGHRRTYVGALPGRIVRAIKEAGSMNPVVLLDEVDKVGSDYRGDPAAALLEVLDPAQNHTFRDHYLELDLDLSDVRLHRHRERRRADPVGPARPDGAGHARRLHRGRQGRDRPRLPAAPAAGARRPHRRRGHDHRRRAARARRELHPRGRRPPARAAAGEGAPQGGHPAGDRCRARRRRRRRTSRTWSAGPGSRPSRPSAPRCPASRPAWPSPGSAATCCSSRPAPPTVRPGSR